MKRSSIHRVFLLALLGFALAYSLPKTQLGLGLDQLTYDSFIRLRDDHKRGPKLDPRLMKKAIKLILKRLLYGHRSTEKCLKLCLRAALNWWASTSFP